MVGWILTLLTWAVLAGAVGLGLGLLALYLRGAFRKRVMFDFRDPPSTQDDRFPHILEGLSGTLDSTGKTTDFWVEADAIFEARLSAIAKAEDTIQFETFYMTPGRRADAFADALIERAQAGVKVQVLVDHNGSNKLSEPYWKRLRDGGVALRFFRRFSWRSPLDYFSRTHRKLLIVDGRCALVGGAGISDDWDGRPEIGDTAPWRDFEVRYEGHVVGVLAGIFVRDWSSQGGELDLGQDIFREARAPEGPMMFVTAGSYGIEASAMKMLFHISIKAARRRVWIASPYFMPEPSTRKVLIDACKAGIDVKVLTMGRCNDRAYVYQAGREAYEELLRGGVELYEYTPAMMHAKAILVDDDWMSTGSANFDPLSFFNNNELNVSHGSPVMREHLEAFFQESFARSEHVTLETWQHRPLVDRVVGKTLQAFRMIF
ncbi:MAG: phospholipase D-like domain-containing protein [Candidatus Sericytochromatia bacterium]